MVPVQPHDQDAVVHVTQPAGHGGRGDSRLETLGGEEMPAGVEREAAGANLLAGRDKGFLRAEPLPLLALVGVGKEEPTGLSARLEEGPEAGEQVDVAGLATLLRHGQESSIKVDIFPSDGLGTLDAAAGEAEKLDKVRGLPPVGLVWAGRAPEPVQDNANLSRRGDVYPLGGAAELGGLLHDVCPTPALRAAEGEKLPELGRVDLAGSAGVHKPSAVEVSLDVGRGDLVDPQVTQFFSGLAKTLVDAIKRFLGHPTRKDAAFHLGREELGGLLEGRDVPAAGDLHRCGAQVHKQIVQAGGGDVAKLGLQGLADAPAVLLDNGVVPASLGANEKVFGNPGKLGLFFLHEGEDSRCLQADQGKSGPQIGATIPGKLGVRNGCFSLVRWAISSAVRAPALHQENGLFQANLESSKILQAEDCQSEGRGRQAPASSIILHRNNTTGATMRATIVWSWHQVAQAAQPTESK